MLENYFDQKGKATLEMAWTLPLIVMMILVVLWVFVYVVQQPVEKNDLEYVQQIQNTESQIRRTKGVKDFYR